MINNYYNPTTHQFINPSRARVLTGNTLDKSLLKRLGFLPYVDSIENIEGTSSQYLERDAIVVNGDQAIQTYRVSTEVLTLLRFVTKSKNLPAAADDTAAASAGVGIGEFYNSSGTVKVRQS